MLNTVTHKNNKDKGTCTHKIYLATFFESEAGD